MFERIPLPLAQAGENWTLWPFGGYGATVLTSAARMLFILAIFVGVCLLLRWLFGPGGRLRPAEFGEGHIAEGKRRKAEIKELRRRCKRGEITVEDFLRESKRIREQ